MGALQMPQGDTLQLVGTAHGIEIRGPGGQLLLTNRMVAQLAEFSVSLLDILQPDPDLEANGDERDGSMGEDDFCDQSTNWKGEPGCPVCDPGGCEHDGREEEHDAEVETWSHWLDHPAELHIGERKGHTDQVAVRP